VERHCASPLPPWRPREVPRAQRRPLAKPLGDFSRRYPDRREAMARAFQTGVYSMQEITDYFGVHYSTVSRAVRRLETGRGSATEFPTEPQNA
jgi:putative transposase